MKKNILAALLLTLSSAGFAQTWPSKPIRVLVGFAPGGTGDVSARVTGEALSKELGQTVIVDNRPGGSGSIAIELLIPDVPTLAEQGYPNMDIAQWFGAVAPAGVPNDVVTRLSAAFNKVLADPRIAQRLFDSGLEVVGGSPADMARRMSVETVIWSKAAKEAGLGTQ